MNNGNEITNIRLVDDFINRVKAKLIIWEPMDQKFWRACLAEVDIYCNELEFLSL